MPVRPERKALYPPPAEWRRIRQAILERAGHCCEGSPRYPGCRAAHGDPHPVTGSKVVLTIAHMDRDLVDHTMANCRALCQL